MIFQDNVIKEYLKNVYFITGTPCGGKTTISRELAKRHNFLVYDIDGQFANHQKVSDAAFQPAMNKVFNDADEFFGRTVGEYKKWLIENTREQLDFVLLDKEPSNIIGDYCNRPDHQDFNDFINSASEPEKAKAVCNETLKSLNGNHYHAIKDSDYYWVERTAQSTVEETVTKVERHFGFKNSLCMGVGQS